MEFVSWDDILFPTEWKNNPNVPNHQPVNVHKTELYNGLRRSRKWLVPFHGMTLQNLRLNWYARN